MEAIVVPPAEESKEATFERGATDSEAGMLITTPSVYISTVRRI
jgi:hypothetical protein